MDPRRGRPRPVRAQPVDVARGERLVGGSAVAAVQAVAALPSGPAHPLGARQDEQFLRRTVAAAYAGREPEHVADGERRRLQPAQSAPREPGHDPDLRLGRTGHERQRSADRHRHPGERIPDLTTRQSERTPGDLDHRLDGLALDGAVGEEPPLHAGARGGQVDPRGDERADQRERDARHEQRRGVEREREQREDDAGGGNCDASPRAAHSARTEDTASAMTSRAAARGYSGAITRRWARTGSASACTSSGRA